jgi:hypothetical protein
MWWLMTMSLAESGSILLLMSYSFISILAHTFTPNESASFISLVDQIKSALASILQYDSSNVQSIKEQAQYARALLNDDVLKELMERNERIGTDLPRLLDSLQNASGKGLTGNISELNDLLEEAVIVRVEKDQLTNTTVQALALANDVNKILDDYNNAFNKSAVSMDMHMNMNKANISSSENMNNDSVKNMYAYLRAFALTNITLERFDTELRGKTNFTSIMDELAKGLDQLRIAIENKESPKKIMELVHGEIQTDLQTALNLELHPGNMSSTISNTNNPTSNHMMTNMS